MLIVNFYNIFLSLSHFLVFLTFFLNFNFNVLYVCAVQRLDGAGVIGVVEGGFEVSERLRSAEQTAMRRVAGNLSDIVHGLYVQVST